MKLLIEQTTHTEIEIEIPCFFSLGSDMLAVLDEKTLVTVFHMGRMTIVKNCDWSDSYHNKKEIAAAQSWPRISELEFFEAYDKALESISLQPKASI